MSQSARWSNYGDGAKQTKALPTSESIDLTLPLVKPSGPPAGPIPTDSATENSRTGHRSGWDRKRFLQGTESPEIYREFGITSAYSNIGGNVVVIGSKPDGSPWQIGIQHPAPSAGGDRARWRSPTRQWSPQAITSDHTSHLRILSTTIFLTRELDSLPYRDLVSVTHHCRERRHRRCVIYDLVHRRRGRGNGNTSWFSWC